MIDLDDSAPIHPPFIWNVSPQDLCLAAIVGGIEHLQHLLRVDKRTQSKYKLVLIYCLFRKFYKAKATNILSEGMKKSLLGEFFLKRGKFSLFDEILAEEPSEVTEEIFVDHIIS